MATWYAGRECHRQRGAGSSSPGRCPCRAVPVPNPGSWPAAPAPWRRAGTMVGTPMPLPPPPAPTEQLPARKGGQDCTPEGQWLIITTVFSTIFNIYGNKLLTHLSVDNINIISVSNTQFHNITLKPTHIRKKIYSYVHSITSTDLHSIYKLRNSQN